MAQSTEQAEQPAGADWRSVVSRYQRPNTRSAVTQLITTLVPLAAILYVMYRSLALVVLDHAAARAAGGRVARAHVHHHARLRARIVLAVEAREHRSSDGSPAC